MGMDLIIKTTHGKIQGEERGGIGIFRGIPYGGPCDGKYRFLPPTPADDWEGVRDCTRNGAYAVQFGTSISGSDFFGDYFSGGHPELFGVAEEQQSENCLVLNVVTPGTDQKKRPVLVYIHGGGFATGSGTLVLGADKMAADEDIVIVGVNHRLNIFGYLYLGAFDRRYESSGMAGMLDLVMALEWVRDNIAAFGGDPEKVTIMGESGGGMKVSTLLAMPAAQGLFRSAIVESGSSVVGRLSKEAAAETARLALQRLGISEGHLEELEKLKAKELLAVCADGPSGGGALDFGPVADDINLMYAASDDFAAPEISRNIPLLVGSSEDETAVFTPMDVLENITFDNLREMLITSDAGRLGTGPSPVNGANVDHIIEVFMKNNRKADTAEHLFTKINSLTSFLGGGSYYQAMSKAEQGGAPVYHYVVAYDSPLPQSHKRYAWHTADLPLQLRIVRHPESEALSRTMSGCIGAFVRTGNPSIPGLPWPEFTQNEKLVMVFDEVCRVEKDPWKELRESVSRI